MTGVLARALAMERDRARVEAVGRVRAGAIGLRARVAAVRAWERTHDPGQVAQAIARVMLGTFGPASFVATLRDGMAASHLAGVDRVQRTIREHGVPRRIRLSSAYANALSFLKKRAKVPADQVAALQERYSDVAVRAAQDLTADALDKVNDALFGSVADGGGVREGVEALRGAFDRAGLVPGANYRLEATFRTQSQLAYAAGRANSLEDPAVQEILWGFEYATVGDDRVRPAHAAMDGVRAPKEDPIWRRWTPPNGYNCRCAVLEIFDRGTATAQPDVRPDDGFDFHPGDLTRDIMRAA